MAIGDCLLCRKGNLIYCATQRPQAGLICKEIVEIIDFNVCICL